LNLLFLNSIVFTSICLQPSGLNDVFNFVKTTLFFLIFSLEIYRINLRAYTINQATCRKQVVSNPKLLWTPTRLHHVISDIVEERTASIFRVEEWAKKKPTRSRRQTIRNFDRTTRRLQLRSLYSPSVVFTGALHGSPSSTRGRTGMSPNAVPGG
jgi:hypothetical protein